MTMSPTNIIKITRETYQMAYLTWKGQIGNITKAKTQAIIAMVTLCLD